MRRTLRRELSCAGRLTWPRPRSPQSTDEQAPTGRSVRRDRLVPRTGGRLEGVAVIEASVPRSWLRRNRRGLWHSVRDVPPERFRRLITFAELARSPIDDAPP